MPILLYLCYSELIHNTMKKLYIFSALIAFFFLNLNCFSQTPKWQWAHSASSYPVPGTGGYGNSISSDASANCYVTGYFLPPNIVFGNDTVIASIAYSNVMYIVKYDSVGNVLWAKCPGADNGSEGFSICTDANGNSYVTGYFAGTAIFGSTTLNAPGTGDVFTAKYDNAGNVIWAKAADANDPNGGFGISTDARGNIYVTGIFDSKTITFDSYTLNNSWPSLPDYNIFLVKYDPNGNVLWAKGAGDYYGTSNSNEYSTGISTDVNGNSYLTGYFRYSITFDTITLTGSATGSPSVFIVKYDNAGNLIWTRSSSSTYPSGGQGIGISLDASDNVYVLGYFSSPVFYIGTDTLNLVNGSSPFIAKYDNAGDFRWAKSAAYGVGGSGSVQSNGISTDSKGNSYLTGDISGVVAFGSINLFSNGSSDIFVAKYDSTGNALWAKGAGGTGADQGYGISVNDNGDCFVTGNFQSASMMFDSITVNNTNIYSSPYNVFVAKLFGNNTSGIKEENFGKDINVFPNPTSGVFNLQINNNDYLKVRNIEIYNVYGACIHRQLCNSVIQQIDFSSQPNGVYFLQMNLPSGILVKKIVKE